MCDPAVWVRYDDGTVRAFTFDRLRLPDFIGSVPWRQVRARHGQAHYAGAYASATTGGFVAYESRLELARLLLADFDLRVRQIYAQPFRLVARVDGHIRCHVPDFLLVTAADTGRLVNVKSAARLEDRRVVRALAWPGVLAKRHGWAYEVWSGADVTMLDNVRFLAAYRRQGVVPAEEMERTWALIRDGEPLADTELRLAGDRPRHEVRPALMALLWLGRVTTDLSRPLSGTSVLRRRR
ncbi:TnsA-like heteromeric transposase endonuclease subunit [Actinoallomurus liliacearum]|uniref:TnsA-like heteromeric transposase endonuclease subunit n=1 Tax=Actinoallomurus liliacearum TaxID=1080073 RepID=A0ABP8TV43_9ACTN